MEQIKRAVQVVGEDNLVIMQSTSSYPCSPEELNLKTIETLRKGFPSVPIGYSGHEVGLVPSVIAVALGACVVAGSSLRVVRAHAEARWHPVRGAVQHLVTG